MGKDSLEGEVQVSAEVTESGVTLKARSRLVTTFDRLGGNILDWINLPLEERTAIRRARLDGQLKVIEAVSAVVAANPEHYPEFLAEAFGTEVELIKAKFVNKRGVQAAALEDLRSNPPSKDQASAGDERLSEEFITRFQRYAEDASTEALREKWGKLLAAEIREPGRVSRRTLRVIDELDSETALLFERLCASRVGRFLPKALVGSLELSDASRLVTAGLISQPSSAGEVSRFLDAKLDGREVFSFKLDGYAICIPKDQYSARRSRVLPDQERRPALSVYVLTDQGYEIASIFDFDAAKTWLQLFNAIRKIADQHLPFTLMLFRENAGAADLIEVSHHDTDPNLCVFDPTASTN